MISVRFKYSNSRFNVYEILKDGICIHVLTNLYKRTVDVFDAINYDQYLITLEESRFIKSKLR